VLDNDQHQLFCQEYIIHFNATKAYKKAYPGANGSASGSAYHLLRKPKIIEEIALLQKKRAEKLKITAENVMRVIAQRAFADFRKMYNPDGSLREPHEIDDDTAAAVSMYDARKGKAKLCDQNRATDQLMEHLGLKKRPSLETILDNLGTLGLTELRDAIIESVSGRSAGPAPAIPAATTGQESGGGPGEVS
jgi:phage terminase small subunit